MKNPGFTWSGNPKFKKMVNGDGNIRDMVWLHIPTAQIGVGLPGTFLGDVWIFAEHEEGETLNGRFANFLDDPRDSSSLPSSEFIELGAL